MTKDISGFFGENRWLSNFWLCDITIFGRSYTSSEAAYQACKTLDLTEKEKFTTLSPGKAKSLGRKITLRSDWEEIKLDAMDAVVTAKFSQNYELQDKLVATGNARLIEYNTWGDTYWGVTDEGGLNAFGTILMAVREQFK